jgi:hypothetical protein
VTGCDRVRADAAGLAALAPDDPDRVAAWAHAQSCAACAAALREGERLQALVAEWRPERLPAAALERASQAIRAELRREARRSAIASVAAAAVSAIALVGLARSRSPAPLDWAIAAALWALGAVLAAAASRRPALVTALAVLGALAATAASGSGPLAHASGVECLATELASAGAVVGAGWLALRGGGTRPARPAIAAAAAAGALVGNAALQLTCEVHDAALHALVFHVGGIVLAAALAALLWRAPRLAPAPAS